MLINITTEPNNRIRENLGFDVIGMFIRQVDDDRPKYEKNSKRQIHRRCIGILQEGVDI